MKSLSILIIAILFLSFQKKTLTWVAIGDSITYLNEHLDETGNRVTEGYMTRVVKRVSNVKYINQGHNGWTSGGLAEKIESLGLTQADIYSVFLGTNDWWGGRPLGKFSDYLNNTGNNTVHGSFRIIIDKLRSLNPKAEIILITPMQRSDFVYLTDMKNNAYGSYRQKNLQSLANFAGAIKDIGKHEGFKVVDLYSNRKMTVKKLVKFKRLKDSTTGKYTNYSYPAYTDIPFNPETDEYPYPLEAIDMTYDGLHPSDKGYKIIAGELLKIFRTYR